MSERRKRIKFWKWARRRKRDIPHELLVSRKLTPVPDDFYPASMDMAAWRWMGVYFG